eukprot:3841420-Amphidinium_carterae.1
MKAIKKSEDEGCIGGLRNPHLAIEKVLGCKMVGLRLRLLLLRFLTERPEVEKFVKEALQGRLGPSLPSLDEARWRVLKLLDGEWAPSALTPLRADILAAYVKAAGDPETAVPEWLWRGAPFGAINFLDANGVFPEVAKNGNSEAPEHCMVPPGWTNYKSADEVPLVVKGLLKKMVDRGWAEEFSSFEELCRKHGGDSLSSPLSKLGLVSKQRGDGSWKHRLVWDLRRSGIN